MDYKIRVNRPCRLFIDGEEIQVLNELQLTKIDLAPGEYLRKVVAIDNPSIFDETVLSISSSKVDLITLDITGLEVARRNALPEERFLVGNLYYTANKDKISVSVSKYNKDFPPKELIIPDTINYAGYNYSVTSIGKRAFYDCDDLTSITIPNSVTSIGDDAFEECSSLTSVTIPNSVTSIGDSAFYDCESLTSITIPNSVTSIGGGAFENCESLTSITIPNSVTSIGDDAFCGCESLTSITIPNSVTSIGERAFYACSSLTSVTIPNSVTSIGHNTFYNCSKLSSITIPNRVKCIGSGAFYGTGIYTNAANWKNGALYINNCLIGVQRDSMGDYTIKAGTRLIAGGAFYKCSALTSVAIPNSVTSIGDDAFEECSSLTSVTIPNSVTSIGDSAFYDCESLTSITIPNSVTSIGYEAFSGCDSLTSIHYTGTKEQWNKIKLAKDWAKNSYIQVIHCTDGEIRL